MPTYTTPTQTVATGEQAYEITLATLEHGTALHMKRGRGAWNSLAGDEKQDWLPNKAPEEEPHSQKCTQSWKSLEPSSYSASQIPPAPPTSSHMQWAGSGGTHGLKLTLIFYPSFLLEGKSVCLFSS